MFFLCALKYKYDINNFDLAEMSYLTLASQCFINFPRKLNNSNEVLQFVKECHV